MDFNEFHLCARHREKFLDIEISHSTFLSQCSRSRDENEKKASTNKSSTIVMKKNYNLSHAVKSNRDKRYNLFRCLSSFLSASKQFFIQSIICLPSCMLFCNIREVVQVRTEKSRFESHACVKEKRDIKPRKSD